MNTSMNTDTMDRRRALYQEADVDRLVRMRLAHISYVPGFTRDELAQEGRAAAWAALATYDAARGTLGSYLTRIIHNHFVQLLGAATAQKRRPPVPPADIDEVPVADGLPVADEAMVAAERARAIRQAIEGAREQLGAVECAVMDAYMAPPPELLTAIRNMGRRKVSKRAVALFLGVSPDRLQTIINRISDALSTGLTDVRP
jgi:DNA-directed RNA polymerase specialized sigma24 family protein